MDQRRALPPADGPDPAAGLGRVLGRLYRGGWEVARLLPGGDAVERRVRRIEQGVVDEVRKRLDGPDPLGGGAESALDRSRAEVDDLAGGVDRLPGGTAYRGRRASDRSDSAHRSRGSTPYRPRGGLSSPARGAGEPLRAAMAELLERSVTDSRDAAREHYFALVMRQLLPDEARIISALSDGSVFPLVHLVARTGIAAPHRYLLENASTVGRAAGVVAPGLVPFYVTRLLRFGLAEIGDEVPALNTQYELLLTDERVRALDVGRLGPRVIRLSLHVSELGAQFWAASDPSARGAGR
ncbi:DUF4393 domain-containing protein [Actinokineospora sp. UTMC 2448]|uniref:DUF4393 domain-containing protein n=1 Tax=Actinokineospora sp. UTMC 2448 TaxID=2268449 RepID=UPI0021642C04|nr:DUF4393 domain-containing protein [Actinokineospora sp. UTMC 2448]UVS76731.1 hypothetical protein Actkin_00426 [Actinokineospora sp. UTMC 2448]